MCRSPPMTFRRRCLIAVRRTRINLPALPLDKVFHPLKFPGRLIRLLKGTPFTVPSTRAPLTTVLGGVHALDTTVFSVGLGNTVSDCIDWSSSIRWETWAGK
jgi:hypothetical protein